MWIQNPKLTYTINKLLLILTVQDDWLISGYYTENSLIKELLEQYLYFID